MIDFEYFAPTSLAAALSLLEDHKKGMKVLAGGTDLIVQMKDGRARPAAIVDAKNIPELNRLGWNGDKVFHIGAAVPLSKIIAFPTVRERFGILQQACSLIGSGQIRNRATLGGNICNAAPSADTAPPLLCLGAKAVITGPGGKRTVPMNDFFRGPGQTVVGSNEILVEVEIPAPPSASAGCYLRHTPREEMDIAVVGVASFLVGSGPRQCREARVALGAVAPTPVMVPQTAALLAGKTLSDKLIEAAAEMAAAAASPVSDVRGSADYRREIIRVLVRRSLQTASEALS
jgi:CO/xanthine dehydrogenase FAD-binding subunit